MTDPNRIRDGDLVHVLAIVKVIFVETIKGVPGASVRDNAGNQHWVPMPWLVRVPGENPNGGT